jgi:hypothetical protein
VFSKFIRDRDEFLCCITCQKKHPQKQAGHYAPVGGGNLELNFCEYNVNGECPDCNGIDSFHLVPMRKNLIEKYGIEIVEDIDARKAQMITTKWTEGDFVTRIKKYV